MATTRRASATPSEGGDAAPSSSTTRDERRMSTNPMIPPDQVAALQERRASQAGSQTEHNRRFKRCGTSELVVFVALLIAAVIAVTAGSVAWDRLDGGDSQETAARILGLVGVVAGLLIFLQSERHLCKSPNGIGPGLDLLIALSFALLNAGTVAIVVGTTTSDFGTQVGCIITTSCLTVLSCLYLVLRLHKRWDGALEPEDLYVPIGLFVSSAIVVAPWMICGIAVEALDGSQRLETFMLTLASCLSLIAAYLSRSHRLLLNVSMLITTIVAAVWCGQEATAGGDVSNVAYSFFAPVGVGALLLILPAITTTSVHDPEGTKPTDLRPYYYDTQHSSGDFMMLCVVIFALAARFGAWRMDDNDGLDVASLAAASLLAFLPAFLVGTAPRASVLGLLVVGFTPATDGLDVSAKNIITWGVALVVVALSRYPTVVQSGPIRAIVNKRLFRRTPRVQRPNAADPEPTAAELAELEAMEKLEAEAKAEGKAEAKPAPRRVTAVAGATSAGAPKPAATTTATTTTTAAADDDDIIDLDSICARYYWMFLQFLVADRYGLAVQELFAATLSFVFTGWWAAPYSKYDDLEDGAVAMVAWPVVVPLLLLFAPVGRKHLESTSSKKAKQIHLYLRRLSVTIAVLSLIAVPVSYASRTVALIYLGLALLALAILTRGGLLGLWWTSRLDVESMRALGARTVPQALSTAIVLTVVGSVGHLNGPEALVMAVVFQVLTFMPFGSARCGGSGAGAASSDTTASRALTRGLSRFEQSARRLMAADFRPLDFAAIVYIAPIVIADNDDDHIRVLAVFLPFVFDALQFFMYEWTWTGLTFKAFSRFGALLALAIVVHDERDDLSYLLGAASLLTSLAVVGMAAFGRAVDDPDTRGHLFKTGLAPTHFVMGLVGIALVDRADANAFYIFLLLKLAIIPYVVLRHRPTAGRVFGATVGLSLLLIIRGMLPSTSPFDADSAPWWADEDIDDGCTPTSDPPCDTDTGREWAQEWASNIAVGLFLVGLWMTGWILDLYYEDKAAAQTRRPTTTATAAAAAAASAAAAARSSGSAGAAAAASGESKADAPIVVVAASDAATGTPSDDEDGGDDDADARSEAFSVDQDNWFTNPSKALPDEITALGLLMCIAAIFSVAGIVESDGAYSISQAVLNSVVVAVSLGYTVWYAFAKHRRVPGPAFFAVVLVFSFLTRADGSLMFVDLFIRLCIWMATYWRRWPSYSTAQLGCLVCCLSWIGRVGLSRAWSDEDWRLATVSRANDKEAWQFAMGLGVIAFTAISAILTIGYNARLRKMPSQGVQQAVAVLEGLLLIAGITLTMPTSIAVGVVALVVLALLLWRSPSLGFIIAPVTVFVTVFQFEWYRNEDDKSSSDREWQDPMQWACFWCAVSTWVLGFLLAARVFPNYPDGLLLGSAKYIGCGYVKDEELEKEDADAEAAEAGGAAAGAADPELGAAALPVVTRNPAAPSPTSAGVDADGDDAAATAAATPLNPQSAAARKKNKTPTFFHFRALDIMILLSLVGLGAGKHDNLSLVYGVMEPAMWALLSASRGSPLFVLLSVPVAAACGAAMYTPAEESYTYACVPLAVAGAVLLLVRLAAQQDAWWNRTHTWLYGQGDQLVAAWLPPSGARLAVTTEIVGTILFLGMSCVGLYILPLALDPEDDDLGNLWWAFFAIVLMWGIVQFGIGFTSDERGMRRMAGAFAISASVFLCLPATDGGSVEQAVLLLIGAVLILVTLGIFVFWFVTRNRQRRRRGQAPTSGSAPATAGTSQPEAA